MLKKAKYWQAFTAPTRAEAEKAAAAWWAEQNGATGSAAGPCRPSSPPARLYRPSEPELVH